MKESNLSPFTKGPMPETSDTPVDRCYDTLPMKVPCKTFGEMEFAAAARANPNGDLAITYGAKKTGDGIGE